MQKKLSNEPNDLQAFRLILARITEAVNINYKKDAFAFHEPQPKSSLTSRGIPTPGQKPKAINES